MYNGHLSIEEIEQLIQQKGPAEYHNHARSCQRCRSFLEDCQAIGAKLDQLASVQIGAESAMNCPDERVWFDVAAGTLSSEVSLQYIGHAAECTFCGQKLQVVTRLFEEALSPEEAKKIAELRSSRIKQQRLLVEGLVTATTRKLTEAAETPRPRKRSLLWPISLSFAGAAAIAIAVLFLATSQNSTADAERLLAAAYTKHRTLELRLPNAEFGPMRTTRGGQSGLAQPAELLEAERIISAHHAQTDSVNWLKARALAEILEWQPDVAVETLTRALESEPFSSSLESDLAIAYFELGETSGSEQYYLKAVEALSEVLSREPRNGVALFNRAVVFEKLKRFDDAIADWGAALKADSSSLWAREARERLDALKIRK